MSVMVDGSSSNGTAAARTGALTVANTYLIGAQKAGTTYLAALLDQRPDVCVSDPKEPQFFTTGFQEGFETYARCFSDPDAQIRLDASTTYSFLRPRRDMERDLPEDAPGLTDPVPQRIAEVCPEARFIYVLRDPVKRAVSAHRHALRTAPPPSGPQSLLKAFEDNPMLVIGGRYADQIERYFEVFGRERFLFLDFRRLTKDTAAVLDEVCDFLGLSAGGITLEDATRAKHTAYRVTSAGRVLRRGMDMAPGLARAAKSIVPAGLKTRLIDPVTKAPSEVTFHDEAQAAEVFAEDLARVEALTGLRI
jgi:hypothetical protein